MKAFLASLLVAAAGTAVAEAPAWAVSADAAAQAVERGAFVVDIRPAAQFAKGHLPGAISLPEAASAETREALQALVSRSGVDLSREVLLVGEPGDARILDLAPRLSGYATGQVTWFVGGVTEWQLSGRPLATESRSRAPVPQYLVQLGSESVRPRMAAAGLRDLPSF
ncbi:MAG: rhodanese-like domain-containing protein [Burkholderiaceae bacterium]